MMGAILALLTSAALAAPPVTPAPEPGDVVAAYATFAQEAGRGGPAAHVVCRPLAESLTLCFAYDDGPVRRLVTEEQLAAWSEDLTAVERRAREAATDGLDARHLSVRTVEGLTGRYWVSEAGDGLDGAGLLYPGKLEEVAGARPVVAVPGRGRLLFWVPGDKEFDKVLAVGVRRMYEADDHPVSPLVYRWDGDRWAVWGEARAPR